jgi:hydroxypyruvate reductase
MCVARQLQRQGKQLIFGKHKRSLDKYRNIYVIGAGKAGCKMAASTVNILGEYFSYGCVIVKDGYTDINASLNLPSDLEIIEAGHPIPDIRGVNGTQKIVDLLFQTDIHDLVICLISGGGSSLLCLPAPGLSLSDLQITTSLLLTSGAPITDINVVRKHIESIKGGQLARASYPSEMITLILSDVVGDPLESIASGPTVPDPSTYEQALLILNRYDIINHVPSVVSNHLLKGIVGTTTETPKRGDVVFSKVHNIIVGSNRMATKAACKQAKREGFKSYVLTNSLEGEAQEVGKILAAIAREAAVKHIPSSRPICLIFGGETTVSVRGTGLGGRNLELALATVSRIATLDDTMIITLATDGGDGLTDAAGAVVTGCTYERAKKLQMDPQMYLNQNDSYNFFEPLNDLIRIGPSLTNVNDIAIIVTY